MRIAKEKNFDVQLLSLKLINTIQVILNLIDDLSSVCQKLVIYMSHLKADNSQGTSLCQDGVERNIIYSKGMDYLFN
jgi:hypothetical protein